MQWPLAVLSAVIYVAAVAAQNGRAATCCLRVTRTVVRLNMVLDYRWQRKGLCPVTAVVFYIKNGVRLCSDPDMAWTTKAMRKVDAERKRKEAEKKGKDSGSDENVSQMAPPLAATELAASSRWLRSSAVPVFLQEQFQAEGPVKSGAAPRSSKIQRKKGNRKRKGKNRVRKRKN